MIKVMYLFHVSLCKFFQRALGYAITTFSDLQLALASPPVEFSIQELNNLLFKKQKKDYLNPQT